MPLTGLELAALRAAGRDAEADAILAARPRPCQLGDRVRFLAVGNRQRTTIDVTLLEPLDSGQWLIGGRRPSRQWPGDYVGFSARVIPAEALEVLVPAPSRS